jgi:hypothetical protein
MKGSVDISSSHSTQKKPPRDQTVLSREVPRFLPCSKGEADGQTINFGHFFGFDPRTSLLLDYDEKTIKQFFAMEKNIFFLK